VKTWIRITLAAAGAGAVAGIAVAAASASRSTVRTVPQLDLRRYTGRWYEIARFPNRFQRACESDVTATYTLRSDGRITVVNECRTGEGKTKKATGSARLADDRGPASELRVTFFWPFFGDYWVIGLDPEYRWAVVGAPDRDYLWILSREPRMADHDYRTAVQQADAEGFDTGKLVLTRQNAAI